jgi:hypothetical protein
MSDIYLQITETPTVVTLSAPVISGALSSTVTVANTVTVALDANSLSALENVTVTVGAAITGTVTVSNFPASQAVTFSAVSISNFPASQAVTFSGISVSNFPASQAVTFSDASLTNTQLRASAVTVGGTVTVGNSLTISSLPAISGTVTANLDPNSFVISSQIESGIGSYAEDLANAPFPISGTVTIGSALPTGTNRIGVVTIGGGTVTLGAGTAQIGSVTAGIGLNSVGPSVLADTGFSLTSRGMMVVGGISTNDVGSDNEYRELKITSTGEALVRGSVTASISGTVPISISSVTVGSVPPIQWSNASGGNAPTTVNQNAPLPVQLYTGAVPSSVTIGAIIANSVTIGSLPAISGTVTANTFALQGTAVTTSNFTSTTASTVLASYNATREVLTIFNEGAGNLHVCVGATCTTVQYQVRLSAGDYYEVPNHQTTITHSAVFATAGTARVTEVS